MDEQHKLELRALVRAVGFSEVLRALAELTHECELEAQLSLSPAAYRAWNRAACVLDWFSGSFVCPSTASR